jgi:hypothetical protein
METIRFNEAQSMNPQCLSARPRGFEDVKSDGGLDSCAVGDAFAWRMLLGRGSAELDKVKLNRRG